MEQIIKKAIEGGYKKRLCPTSFVTSKLVTLDPLFWQALGKACGWGDEKVIRASLDKGGYRTSDEFDGFIYDETELNTWQDNAIHFHEVNLTKGFDEAMKWLEDLIK